MTNSAAWHDLNAVARAIYCEMAKRYAGDGSNNGRLPYSIREAAAELRISRTTASRALNSLEDHGFIVAITKGAFSLKKRHATEWRLTEFPCDVTHTVSTKDFMRWRPNTKIQNTVSMAKLSGPVAKPNGTCGETDRAEKPPNGICSETVRGNFHDSRFHQRDTTSLPGDRAVIPLGTTRQRRGQSSG
jgi:DNA-binding transcriptional MocR family regulator